jgi:hypothetical protein
LYAILTTRPKPKEKSKMKKTALQTVNDVRKDIGISQKKLAE